MKVFITGGTGFIGSAVIKELVGAGHEVTGLARSEKSKQALAELGASAVDGALDDAESLKRGAVLADAVIHCAFVHNFADFAACCATDSQAITALGEALAGTGKALIVTSGVPAGAPGHVVTENDETDNYTPRRSEPSAMPFAERGVRVSFVRPSRFVFDETLTTGFIAGVIGAAQQKGVSAYIGNGENRIHAVHVLDLAKLYLLTLEKGKNGAKYQAVGDWAVDFRSVAEAVGKKLNVPCVSIPPEQAAEHFGFLGMVAAADNPASSKITQAALGWKPINAPLLKVLG